MRALRSRCKYGTDVSANATLTMTWRAPPNRSPPATACDTARRDRRGSCFDLHVGGRHQLVDRARRDRALHLRPLLVGQRPEQLDAHSQLVDAVALVAIIALDVRIHALERNAVALRVPPRGEPLAT